MSALQTYQCPCCGGAIAFNSSAQNLKCEYCGTEFKLKALQSFNDSLQREKPDEIEWSMETQNEWQTGEAEGLHSYLCHACGGEIITDATTAATACPFCGNPVVMQEMFSGSLKPDLVIPFKLDKNTAKEKLKQHYSGKKLLPKAFQDENHLDEIKGVYVPVWLFDAKASANIRYHGITTRHWSDKNYNYTETNHYALYRAGNLVFSGIPVDGSEKMPNEMIEAIEPFDLSQAVDFQTAYLAGYLADKYDVGMEQSIPRANQRIHNSVEQAFRSTVNGFMNVVAEHSDIQTRQGRVRYALYPVWLLNTTWNGTSCHFIMNGQTGKLVGDLPIDKGLKRKYFWQTVAIASGIAFAVQALLYLVL